MHWPSYAETVPTLALMMAATVGYYQIRRGRAEGVRLRTTPRIQPNEASPGETFLSLHVSSVGTSATTIISMNVCGFGTDGICGDASRSS